MRNASDMDSSNPMAKRLRLVGGCGLAPSSQLQQPANFQLVIDGVKIEDEEEQQVVSDNDQQPEEAEEGEDEEEQEEVVSDDDQQSEEGEYESPEEGNDDDQDESEKPNASPPEYKLVSDGLGGDGSITVTLTDPGVLDCSICLEPLDVPVFQCKNGHIACSSCCIKVGHKCPSCSIGYNRCRALEKVIESVEVSCQNMKFGCKEAVRYCKKHEHKETCIYAPCLCPIRDCNLVYTYKDLFLHFKSKHQGSVEYFRYNNFFLINLEIRKEYLILQEQDEYVIFILTNGIETLGNLASVSCIGPSTLKEGHAYELTARNGISSLRLQSCTEKIIDYIPGGTLYPPPKSFLLVPGDFVSSCGQLQLGLRILRHHEPPGC